MTAELLPVAWAVFMGLSILLYVVLDGYALGLGMLFLFAEEDRHRDIMMRSVLPTWDGNQTWLVGAGMALLTAFPAAFNILLSSFYLPLMFMLLALVARGAAFEFRFKAKNRRPWDICFSVGALVAAMCQGLVLGNYVLGFGLGREAMDFSDLFSPFALFCAAAVPVAYTLLGACWLQIKSTGELQKWAIRRARRLLPVFAGAIVVVSLWTPWEVPAIAERWFSWPNVLLMSPLPIWTALLVIVMYWSLGKNNKFEALPFVLAVGLIVVTLLGLEISLWPYVVPRSLTIWDAAAPESSLLFAMVGVLFVVPMVLAYTINTYWVFRGKVDEHGETY